jgi:putative hydrolase of the HAD superfamily
VGATVEVIGFDADDTLWHDLRSYKLALERAAALLEVHRPAEAKPANLERTVRRMVHKNTPAFGVGMKSFLIGCVEALVELTQGRIPAAELAGLLELGKELAQLPVEVLPGVEETLRALSGRYRMVVVTVGELHHQEQKVASSGLDRYFEAVEIVPEKTAARYRSLLGARRIAPERFLMVGNSLTSDILPVLEIGARALYVPTEVVAERELAELAWIKEIRELPAWLERMETT